MGDYGGGGMFLAFGIVCGILEARTSGKGQVVDAAMVDGAAVLMSAIWGFAQSGLWLEEPGVNLLDTGAAYYDTYATSDGKWISFGAIEDQFFAEFLERVGLRSRRLPEPHRARTRGPRCTSGSPSSSSRRRATSGASCSREPTCASRRCCR